MGVRKNQSALTPQEKQDFVNAVLALKANGTYDQFVQMHLNSMSTMSAHQRPAFLPWHREFLRRYELELQNINPNVTLPYWDWTVDDSPNSSIWGADFMGGNGRPSDGRVTTGPFAYDNGNWTLTVDGPDLKRRFGQSSSATTLPTTTQVDQCLAVNQYDSSPWNITSNLNTSFRNRLEGWGSSEPQLHNRVHVWVGGSMLPMSSPNDPVFFLHHCNVDRLWAIWQTMHPSSGYLPINGGPSGHNLNDPMQPWGGATTPASVLNISSLGYSYDSMPPSTTPPGPTPTPTPTPNPPRGPCFIATAAYGSELEPPVQFLRDFRDNVVLQSRFKKSFEKILDEYYKFSPPIAELMRQNKPFKYTVKYTVVWPFVALARATAFIVEPFVDDDKKSKQN